MGSIQKKRNYVNNSIKRCKNTYYDKLLKENTSNSEKLWSTIKEIFPVKANKQQTSTVFNIDGKEEKNPNLIANGLCIKFFSSVAQTLRKKVFPLKNCIWSYHEENKYCETVFKFSYVTTAEISRHPRKLKRNKSVGADELPPGYLKDISDSIAKPFAHIVNMSLQTGEVPEDFKIAKITPLFKSGSPKETDNYRPISVLPIMSKILEKIVHNQLMRYLDENKLLSSKQFGFRPGRSTELTATLLTSYIRKGMDDGKYTGVIYIDLSKAFDTISHGTIISKLKDFGIMGIPNEWFSSYLFNRKQQVHYNGILSTTQPILNTMWSSTRINYRTSVIYTLF